MCSKKIITSEHTPTHTHKQHIPLKRFCEHCATFYIIFVFPTLNALKINTLSTVYPTVRCPGSHRHHICTGQTFLSLYYPPCPNSSRKGQFIHPALPSKWTESDKSFGPHPFPRFFEAPTSLSKQISFTLLGQGETGRLRLIVGII